MRVSSNPNIPYNASTIPSSYGEGFFILGNLGDLPLILASSKAKVNKKYKGVKVKLSTPSSYSKPETAMKRTRLIDIIILKLKK